MAGRIGTQHMLGGKKTFNPLRAVCLPLSSLLCVPSTTSSCQAMAVLPV